VTKRNAIRTALAEGPSWTDRRVAEHCSVSYNLVARVRQELAEAAAPGDYHKMIVADPGPGPATSHQCEVNRTRPDRTGPNRT
jgi:hypothetical protein